MGLSHKPEEETKRSELSESVFQISKNMFYEKVTGLEAWGISDRCLSSLFLPPHAGQRSAKFYQGLIEAKVPCVKSDRRDEVVDGHFAFTQVKIAQEFAEMFFKEVTIASVDGMDRVMMGVVCKSRYQRLNRYTLVDDSPNLDDHDFPYPGYYLKVQGILLLEKPHSELHEEVVRSIVEQTLDEGMLTKALESGILVKDKFDRLHFDTPTNGPLHLSVRANKYTPVTIQSNVNDLLITLKSTSKHSLVVIADGGGDYRTTFPRNMLYYFRLWAITGSHSVVVVRNAAKLSAINPIERRWAGATRRLACTILPAFDGDDDKTPDTMSQLTEEERRVKDFRVFNNAMSKVADILQPLKSKDHPTTVRTISPDAPEEPLNVMQEINSFIEAGNKSRAEQKDMMQWYHGMLDHISRATYMIQFHPCESGDCGFDCATRKSRCSIEFQQTLRLLGGRLPGVCPSPTLPDHNATLMDFISTPTLGGEFRGADDQHLPTKSELGKCDMGCKCYVFQSKTDKIDHELLAHRAERQRRQLQRRRGKPQNAERNHICSVPTCNMVFKNERALGEHKREALHRAPRKRKATPEVLPSQVDEVDEVKETSTEVLPSQINEVKATLTEVAPPEMEDNMGQDSEEDSEDDDEALIQCSNCRKFRTMPPDQDYSAFKCQDKPGYDCMSVCDGCQSVVRCRCIQTCKICAKMVSQCTC